VKISPSAETRFSAKDAADQTVIDAEFHAVLKAASAAEVVALVIEELLNEEIDDAVLGDRLARL
jgi:hypothetical protein